MTPEWSVPIPKTGSSRFDAVRCYTLTRLVLVRAFTSGTHVPSGSQIVVPGIAGAIAFA